MKWKRKTSFCDDARCSGSAPNGIYADEEPLLLCRHSVDTW